MFWHIIAGFVATNMAGNVSISCQHGLGWKRPGISLKIFGYVATDIDGNVPLSEKKSLFYS